MSTSNERKRPILKALVGFLVFFLGVWLGLLAENYREDRQERADERMSLERLISDLEWDHRDMTLNLQSVEAGYAASRWILEHSDTRGVDADSLGYYLTELQHGVILTTNPSEYTALRSSGRINIIRNVELRQRLTAVHEWQYPYLRTIHEYDAAQQDWAMRQVSPFVRTGLALEDSYVPPTRVVGDPDDILSEPYFLRGVGVTALCRDVLVRYYESFLRENEELRDLALAELGRAEDSADL
jgi:hypothetical protein